MSVVIPVYNQYDSLMLCLSFFANQTFSGDLFEVIIVDDGSDDNLRFLNDKDMSQFPYHVKIVHQDKMGRAVARNTGAEISVAEHIIFCDGDRIPAQDFVEKHYLFHKKNKNSAIFGCPKDYYGKLSFLAFMDNSSYLVLNKYSKIPVYYKKVVNLYNEQGYTDSELAWITFLVGNSSMSRKNFYLAGGFNPQFKEWGFEHYDLALNLMKNNVLIYHQPSIVNHIPHKRGTGFYMEMICNSLKLLILNHPDKFISPLGQFLFGEISLQEFEHMYSNKITKSIACQNPIYYKNLK